MAVFFQQLLALWTAMLLTFVSQSDGVAITGSTGGVNTATGQRPFRQEFSSFSASGPAFDLFIQSLKQFQAQDQSALLSFYQVSGIHGYPVQSWDGVSGGFNSGYCTHSSILFPTWHRPYVALYEQIIWNNAQTIASTYPSAQKATYQAAATTLRIPYWDWASTPLLPDAVISPKININLPTGPASIDNPLYNYTFHPLPYGTDFPTNDPTSKYPSTVRSPSGNQSQEQVTQQQLQSNGAIIQTLTYQLLSSVSNYTVFSNTALNDRGANYNSLENIHNMIHVFVGNGGHMTYVPFSAFDPVFWLHHANVDRLFAIWQALYPNSYVTPLPSPYGTFTEAPNTIENTNSALTPFHSTASGALWTPTTARSTRTFGYTYPEIVDWGVNATKLAATVRSKVNALYNPSGTTSPTASDSGPVPNRAKARRGSRGAGLLKEKGHGARNTTANFNFNNVGLVTLEMGREMGVNNMNKQWAINAKVDKFALPSSFYIHFFLFNPPASPTDWSTASNLIGSHAVFSGFMSNATRATMPPAPIYGQIPLTHSLAAAVHAGIIPNLEPYSVIPLLKSGLQWRVKDMDDCGWDVDSVAGLAVDVACRDVVPSPHDEVFPIYGDWEMYKECTEGRTGGS